MSAFSSSTAFSPRLTSSAIRTRGMDPGWHDRHSSSMALTNPSTPPISLMNSVAMSRSFGACRAFAPAVILARIAAGVFSIFFVIPSPPRPGVSPG